MTRNGSSLAWFSMVLVVLAFGLAPAAASHKPAPLVIVQNGQAKMPILAGSVEQPVKELQAYLKRMSGAELAIEPAKRGAAGVHVGLAKDFPWVTFDDIESLGPEGFLLKSDGKSLYVVANAPAGVAYGVWFLLQQLGCRWFFPGQVWEDVPSLPTIQGVWDERQTPTFRTQRRIRFAYRGGRPGSTEIERWYRQNLLGGSQQVSIGHTWYGLDKQADFKAHPEWFALIHPKASSARGKAKAKDAEEAQADEAAEPKGVRRPSKPCYSHPAVIKRAIETTLAKAEKMGGKGMISLTPPDGLNFCECQKCFSVFQGSKPKYTRHRVWFATRPDGVMVGAPSETVFAMVNAVAREVGKRYPDILIGCYAYSGYSHPASFKMEPNVYIQTTTHYRRTPLTLEEQLRQWGRKARRVDIRGYYSVIQWDYDNPFPQQMLPARQSKELRFFAANNVSGVNSEASNNWAPRGLGYYCAAAMHWNAQADPEALMADFYKRAFGPAEAPMRAYYEIWYVDPQPKANRYTKEMLAKAHKALDRAVALTAGQDKFRRRVDALRMYIHYLLLRMRVNNLEDSKDKDAILQAVKDETVFGMRLMTTHMIHSSRMFDRERFLRRFRTFADLLGVEVTDRRTGKVHKEPAPFTNEWRKPGQPPSAEELQALWNQDKKELGIR